MNDDKPPSGISPPIDAPGSSPPLVQKKPAPLEVVKPIVLEHEPTEKAEPAGELLHLVPVPEREPEPEPGTVVPGVVAMLRECLESAERGELQAVAVAGFREGVTVTSFEPAGLDAGGMLLAIERLRFRLLGVSYDSRSFHDPTEPQP